MEIILNDDMKLNAGDRITKEQMATAAIASYIEQIPIVMLSNIDNHYSRFVHSDIGNAVKDAMGLGERNSSIARPFTYKISNLEIEISVIAADSSFVISYGSKNIALSEGFLKNVVFSAINDTFGDIESYKRHLDEIDSWGASEPSDISEELVIKLAPFSMKNSSNSDLNLPKIAGTYIDSAFFTSKNGSVPIGEILHSAYDNKNDGNVLKDVLPFGAKITAQLIFASAHELAHIEFKHSPNKNSSCADIIKMEIDADVFAANIISEISFNISPHDKDFYGDIFSYVDFFHNYDRYEFSGLTPYGSCHYPSKDERSQNVSTIYNKNFHELLAATFSAADYSTPNPEPSVCRSDEGD